MATLSKRLGVPLITLYLVAGAIFGAACAGLGIAAPPAVQSVTAALHNACLALITVAAGCELDPEALRSNARTIRATVVALCVSAPLVVGGAYLVLLPRATADDDAALQAVVALFCGVIAIARSPSSAIAVVSEARSDGPFTQTVLGVTMVTDVAVIVLFGGAVELATLALGAEAFDAGSMAARLLLRTLAKLALSVALGALLAAALHLLLRAPAPPPLRPPAPRLYGE